MNEQEVYQEFIQTKALLNGHFILRSGLHSRQFFQCARVLQYPERADRLTKQLALKLVSLDFDGIVSPAMGGILVGHDLARHLKTKHFFAEKNQGSLVIRRFEIAPGERFIVAEDVITTGSAVRETCELVKKAGGIVCGVVCLVDRSSISPEFGVPMMSLLKIPVETFPPDQLPDDLKLIPAFKPGSV